MLNSFLGAMLLTTMVLLVITRLAAERLIHQHQGQKNDFFRGHPIRPGDIVFLGDSITDGARWDEIYPGLPAKNRGINADLTTGVLARLDDVTGGQPAAIFILIGTNDLPWFEYRSTQNILKTYREILQGIKDRSPETKVYVQSVLPRDRMYAGRVLELNRGLVKLAAEFGYAYIDLYSRFTDSHGSLKNDLTNDHLHLLAGGYQLWASILDPYIKNIQSSRVADDKS
jgi:lysophospholipase L1-like esterase